MDFRTHFLKLTSLGMLWCEALFPPQPKKALITDLDETLWSGVLGDDGPAAVTWDLDHKTQFFALYQQLLNFLADSGTLVGVASKNDLTLVKQVFERSDLVVKPDNLFPIEAHWEAKSLSVARTLETWNIAADSVVFVDDNELELEQLKRAFPGLDCVLFSRDDAQFLRDLRDRFGKRDIRQEDVLRSRSLLQGEVIREAASLNTLDSLLEGAEANVTLNWTKEPLDARALELVNKTNQFSLNGARFTEAEWRQLVDQPDVKLLVVEYEDRFGKLGKIAVIAGRDQVEAFSIEAWVMSCRAFSRRIEYQILDCLFERWNQVLLRFERTERNGPFEAFMIGSRY